MEENPTLRTFDPALSMSPQPSEKDDIDRKIILSSSRNFELEQLQLKNWIAASQDRCVDQKDELLQHEIKQITAIYEGPLSIFVDRLRELKEKLDDKVQRAKVLEHTLSKEIPQSDEFGNLLQSILGSTYEVAQQSRVNAARAQLMSNSDQQAKKLAPIIKEIRAGGAKTLQEIADGLNDRDMRTKNGHIWYSSTVSLLMQKIKQIEQEDSGQTLLG